MHGYLPKATPQINLAEMGGLSHGIKDSLDVWEHRDFFDGCLIQFPVINDKPPLCVIGVGLGNIECSRGHT